MNIPDNSIVFLGTVKTAFVTPAQNPNVKYYGYILPKDIEENAFWANHIYKNKYYNNEYLGNKIKEIFSQDNELYIIYNLFELQDDMDLYNQSIRYYSQDRLSGAYDCKNIDYEVLGYSNEYDKYIICKIK